MSKRAKSIGAFFCDKGHLHVTMFDRKNCAIAEGTFELEPGAELVLALMEQLEALMPDDGGSDETVTIH